MDMNRNVLYLKCIRFVVRNVFTRENSYALELTECWARRFRVRKLRLEASSSKRNHLRFTPGWS